MRIVFAVAFLVVVVAIVMPLLSRSRAAAASSESFAVGATTLHFGPKLLKLSRSVTASVWYPAADASAHAPIAAGRYPVLLYFPGWGGQVGDNASLLENLARNGFIVVGVSYPEGADLPDPKIPMQFVPDSAYISGTAQGNRMVQIQAEDASSVLDALAELDKKDPDNRFAGRLNMKRIGVLGYSLGGSVAAESALRDPRFHAVMNLDGWMFSDAATKFFTQPYLVISDDLAAPTSAGLNSPNAFLRNFSQLRERDAKHQTAQLTRAGGYRVTIAGSSHFTFSDHAQANVKNAGPIDPKRAMAIVGAYAVDFFGKNLEERLVPLLDKREARFSEVKLEMFSGVHG